MVFQPGKRGQSPFVRSTLPGPRGKRGQSPFSGPRRNGALHRRRERSRGPRSAVCESVAGSFLARRSKRAWSARSNAICLAETVAEIAHEDHDLEFFLAAVAQGESNAPTRSLLVRITTASGLEGWGESSLGWRMGELAARRGGAAGRVGGPKASMTSRNCTRWRRFPPAPLRSAVEMAVWDLARARVAAAVVQSVGWILSAARCPSRSGWPDATSKSIAHISREKKTGRKSSLPFYLNILSSLSISISFLIFYSYHLSSSLLILFLS